MLTRFIQLLAIGAAATVLATAQAPGIQITAPSPNVAVRPGSMLLVSVATSKSYVAVYVVGDNPLGVSSQALRNAPYVLSIQIPTTTKPGTYNIAAIGALSTGYNETSNPVAINVTN